jgi:hypothetical protein
LNELRIPFRTKVISDPNGFRRADSGVLYIERAYSSVIRDLIWNVYQELSAQMGTDAPMFTKQIAPGLGFAEDPGNGESFGQSRCRIAVDGLWNCLVKQEESRQGRVEMLKTEFRKHGIAPEKPYLNSSCAGILVEF